MAEDARYSYSSKDHNRLLLLALVEAWGSKCYWCRTPKTFRNLQIDHVAPRSSPASKRPEFDIDHAANLAPICGPCNQEKSNSEFWEAPRVDGMRKAAAVLAPQVQRNFTRFRKDGVVVKALLAVTAADLESDDAAEALSSFGSLILPVFRDRYPEVIAAPYTKDYTIRHSPVEIQGRLVQLPDEQSFVELDLQSRRALVILEDVLGMPMATALDDIRGYFGDDIDNQVKAWLRRQYIFTELFQRPSANPFGVYVNELRYADGLVTLTGEVDGSFTADIEDEDDYEARNRTRLADFDFVGPLSVTYSREGLTDAYVDIGEPEENKWRTNLFMSQYDD